MDAALLQVSKGTTIPAIMCHCKDLKIQYQMMHKSQAASFLHEVVNSLLHLQTHCCFTLPPSPRLGFYTYIS